MPPPLRYVDPTGEDIWQINTVGEVVAHEVTDEFDRFDFVDDDGNTIVNDDGEEQSITMEYGTVKNYRNEIYAGINSEAHGSKSGNVDIFEIKGDNSATKLFEMFANNVTMKTSNEIGLIRTGKNGEKSPNFIVSGYQPKSEPGTSVLINGQLQYGYYIREIIHSHPNDDFASIGDFLFKSDIQNFLYDKYRYCASFMIYHIPSKRYIKF